MTWAAWSQGMEVWSPSEATRSQGRQCGAPIWQCMLQEGSTGPQYSDSRPSLGAWASSGSGLSGAGTLGMFNLAHGWAPHHSAAPPH